MRKLNLKIVSMTIAIFLAGFFIFPSIILAVQDVSGNLGFLSADSEGGEYEGEEENEGAEDFDDAPSIVFATQNSTSSNGAGGTSGIVKLEYNTGGMVKYVYELVLDRDPSQSEINSWVNNFNNGNASSYVLVKTAIFGIETGPNVKDLDNKGYIYFLYKFLFQRSPDLDGLNAWYNRLQSGKSKNEVLEGFIVSQEFASFCSKFDVKPYLSREINNKNISSLYAIGPLPAAFTSVDIIQEEPSSSSNDSSSSSSSSSSSNNSTSSPPRSNVPPGMSGDCSSCH